MTDGERAGEELLDQMSLMDPQVQSNPYHFYELMHAHSPVYRLPETGAYVVSRYDDVRRVLLNHRQFSNVFGDSLLDMQSPEGRKLYEEILAARGWKHRMSLENADPPLHTKHRKLVETALTKMRVQALTPKIEKIIDDLIDGFIDKGQCEFVRDFAIALSGTIVAGMIGLDATQLDKFKRWADALLAPITHMMDLDEIVETANLEVELQLFLAEMYEDRTANPQDDLLTVLATKPADDGNLLPMDEYQFIMRQMIAAGFDTLQSAMSHGLWLLIRYPDQMEKLRADLSLIPNFVEEVLRFESPVQGLLRRAVEDVEVAGVTIPKDSVVIVRYGAANRDEKQFKCPHQFDITRSNAATHLAFGNGVHFCVGRILARQELHSAYRALLTRLDNIRLDGNLPDPPHRPDLLLRTLKELRIRFDKRQPAPADVPQSALAAS